MFLPYAFAERNVPRYTSYPTTPHFSAVIGPDEYAQWLGALAPDARLSFYIHVPYCSDVCLYCGCHTQAAHQRAPVDFYAERLIDEIARVAETAAGRRVTHLHWGGGTPSILGTYWLRQIVRNLDASFDLSEINEHAIELDPRHVSTELVQTLTEIGVNRASLGVQDFSPHVQRAIGRIQPFEQVAHAVGLLHEAGISNINIDLMYGLPHQSADDVDASAQLAALLSPQRIVLFGYAHVPWLKANQKRIDEAALPGVVARLAQAQTAAETLTAFGYVAIGLDHFALPGDPLAVAAREGRLHRNFQGYTVDDAEALIGLGASAIGKLPQGFVQNAVDMAGYMRRIDGASLATAKGFATSVEDERRAMIIERLMCGRAVDLGQLAGAYSAEIQSLRPLIQEALVEFDGVRLSITERGRPFSRIVAAAFDTYLPANAAQHSVAV